MSLRCPCLYHLLATPAQFTASCSCREAFSYPSSPHSLTCPYFAAVSECLLISNVLTFIASPLKGGKKKTASDESQATEEFCGGAAVSRPQGGVHIFELSLLPGSLWNKDGGTWRAPRSGEVARPPCSF